MNAAQLAVTLAFAMAAGTFAHEQDADSLAGQPSADRATLVVLNDSGKGPVPLRLD
jgi:hypothetical protein